ncbi:MAG: 4-(cytidine 5'-diphospho)-2-C-methyl-D-erythritol kinase [Candidatus Aadella gelida]|nr:4-(cytidine 5'-diphospho)-2-C-methyl-D-erythritol kinase [Candidatus Aadella gelida]
MITINASAKLNLCLKVISKRTDGYHNIETLFERIDLSDTITVGFGDEVDKVQCDNPEIPLGGDRLVGRCIKKFRERAGCKAPFDISIVKRIPVSAGLGGGSSDAAAVLKGLNELTGQLLQTEELIEIGRELGADIPFFITGHSFAFGTGRGDEIEKAEAHMEIAHILINPPFGTCTEDIYRGVSAFSLTNTKGIDKMFNVFLKENDINAIAENIYNDLQPIALQENPSLQKAFDEIKASGAKGVLLSGSGPTVFGIFDKKTVKSAKKRLETIFPQEQGWGVYETYTC